ncbi:MAG: hypothetical protein ABSD73_00240 [Candidatus Bathyarchaeia archaeon]|jgi:hypothetical protein
MVDITEISALVAAAGVLVGVAYYVLDMRNQTKMRQMDFVLRLPSSFIGRDVFETIATVMKTEFKTFDDYEEKCGIEARQVAGLGEDLGLLVKKKVVEFNLVYERYDVRSVYEKLKPWIEESRRRTNNPRNFEYFEYLYNEEKKREQKLKKSKA